MRMLTYIIGILLISGSIWSAYDIQSGALFLGIGAVVAAIFWDTLTVF